MISAHPLSSQVELRKGKERARCYPVRGAGPHGWCNVQEQEDDGHKEVAVELKPILIICNILDRTGDTAATTVI